MNNHLRIPQPVKDLTEKEVRELIKSLQNRTWEEEHPLRELAIKVHGDDNVVSMLALAVPLAIALESITSKH